MPVPGGSVTALRSFLNVQSEHDFALVVAWTLACLRNRVPYPTPNVGCSAREKSQPRKGAGEIFMTAAAEIAREPVSAANRFRTRHL